jgi:tetratricopeptide (TPR) repeat protein
VKKQRARKEAARVAPAQPVLVAEARAWRPWQWIGLLAGSLLLSLAVYAGALRGPLLLDDLYLPYGGANPELLPVTHYYGLRPLLGVTFFLNAQTSGTNTFGFHLTNVLLHWICGVLVFLIVRKLLETCGERGRRDLWALCGAGVFLLHPIQTEAVAYIASRSDVLCTLFSFAAILIFLQYRRGGIGVLPSIGVLLLSGCAVLSKEQAAVLPVTILLIDLLWPEQSRWKTIVRNWKLYAPLVIGGVFGSLVVLRTLRYSDTAGFNVQGLAWYEYFFTQCRVLWLYVRLVLIPVGLNVDHDIPISRGLFDYGAFLGLVALLAAVGLAWWRRSRYPLAFFGLLVLLVFFAPTSSFLPIRDPAAERRVYAPMLGFTLIAIDLLRTRRWNRVMQGALALVLGVLAFLTLERASLYGSAIELWADSALKSPNKMRPHFQLAYALYTAGNCKEAVAVYAKTAQLAKPDVALLTDWAHALECAGHPDEAISKLRAAAALENKALIHATIGMVQGKHGRLDEALAALAEAEKLDPAFGMTYVYRGNVMAARGDWNGAAAQYTTALRYEPNNQAAADALARAQLQLQR